MVWLWTRWLGDANSGWAVDLWRAAQRVGWHWNLSVVWLIGATALTGAITVIATQLVKAAPPAEPVRRRYRGADNLQERARHEAVYAVTAMTLGHTVVKVDMRVPSVQPASDRPATYWIGGVQWTTSSKSATDGYRDMMTVSMAPYIDAIEHGSAELARYDHDLANARDYAAAIEVLGAAERTVDAQVRQAQQNARALLADPAMQQQISRATRILLRHYGIRVSGEQLTAELTTPPDHSASDARINTQCADRTGWPQNHINHGGSWAAWNT